jgi:hypothetical protein
MPKLVIRLETFYSRGDEDAFFERLNSLSSVSNISGHLRDLHVIFSRPPSGTQLKELFALLRRYRIKLKPLSVLRTPQNARLFDELSAR